jgi:hypothetical protein
MGNKIILTQAEQLVLSDYGEAKPYSLTGRTYFSVISRSLERKGCLKRGTMVPPKWDITYEGRKILECIKSGIYRAIVLTEPQRNMILAIETNNMLTAIGKTWQAHTSTMRSLCIRKLVEKTDNTYALTVKGKEIAMILQGQAFLQWKDAQIHVGKE